MSGGRFPSGGRAFPQLVVLGGGLGTRLSAAIGDDLPKSLAPAGGRPFIVHLLERFAMSGAVDVLLLVGRGADQVREVLGDGSALALPGAGGARLRLTYSEEPEPLGTGGAVVLAHQRGLLARRFMLANGDTLLDADARELVVAHRGAHRDHSALATFAAVQVDDASRYGTLVCAPWTDRDEQARGASLASDFQARRKESNAFRRTLRLTDLAEKAASGPGLVSAGVYVFERGLFEDAPRGRALSLEQDLAPAWLAAGFTLAAWVSDGIFTDIGTPESYEGFCRGGFAGADSEARPADDVDPGGDGGDSR